MLYAIVLLRVVCISYTGNWRRRLGAGLSITRLGEVSGSGTSKSLILQKLTTKGCLEGNPKPRAEQKGPVPPGRSGLDAVHGGWGGGGKTHKLQTVRQEFFLFLLFQFYGVHQSGRHQAQTVNPNA